MVLFFEDGSFGFSGGSLKRLKFFGYHGTRCSRQNHVAILNSLEPEARFMDHLALEWYERDDKIMSMGEPSG